MLVRMKKRHDLSIVASFWRYSWGRRMKQAERIHSFGLSFRLSLTGCNVRAEADCEYCELCGIYFIVAHSLRMPVDIGAWKDRAGKPARS